MGAGRKYGTCPECGGTLLLITIDEVTIKIHTEPNREATMTCPLNRFRTAAKGLGPPQLAVVRATPKRPRHQPHLRLCLDQIETAVMGSEQRADLLSHHVQHPRTAGPVGEKHGQGITVRHGFDHRIRV